MRWLDPEQKLPRVVRWAAVPVVGLTVTGYVALVLALLIRSLSLAIALTALGAAVAITGWGWHGKCWRTGAWRRVRPALAAAAGHAARPTTWGVVLVLAIAAALSVQVLLPEKIFVQAVFVGWGDTALHLGLIEHFAVVQPFSLEHPFFASHPLSYPFFIDFLSGVYRRLGASTLLAFHLPTLTFLCCGLLLLYQCYRRLVTRRGLALLCLVLALFGAGLGWIWLGRDLQAAYQGGGSSAVLELLRAPPHEYTHLDVRTSGLPAGAETANNIMWIVPVVSFLTHQRAFTIGLALAVLVLLGAIFYRGTPRLARYGLLAGMLPLAHGHTFIALAIMFGGLLLAQPRASYVRFGLVTVVVAAPSLAYLWSAMHGGGQPFIQWWWGWMTCTHRNHWFACDVPADVGTDTSVLWFWTKNFGGVLWAWLAAVAAMLWVRARGHARQVFPLVVPSLLLFAAPNLLRFQPWEFDNNKIFFWWWIIALAIIGQAVALMQKRWCRVVVIAGLAVVVLPAGVMDVSARISRYTANHATYVGESEVLAAAWIRQSLPPDARIASAPTSNNFIPMLTGRAIALGYEGWLWSEGANFAPRRAAIEALARGEIGPACAQGITHVMVDADFTSKFAVDAEALAKVTTSLWRQTTDNGATREILSLGCPP